MKLGLLGDNGHIVWIIWGKAGSRVGRSQREWEAQQTEYQQHHGNADRALLDFDDVERVTTSGMQHRDKADEIADGEGDTSEPGETE